MNVSEVLIFHTRQSGGGRENSLNLSYIWMVKAKWMGERKLRERLEVEDRECVQLKGMKEGYGHSHPVAGMFLKV